jgi:site-specific DNA recombinase
MTISLAFLAPDLVRAAVEGRLPRGVGVERLRDAPVSTARKTAKPVFPQAIGASIV